MSSAAIMDAVLTKIKTVLSESKEVLACDVSPEQVTVHALGAKS